MATKWTKRMQKELELIIANTQHYVQREGKLYALDLNNEAIHEALAQNLQKQMIECLCPELRVTNVDPKDFWDLVMKPEYEVDPVEVMPYLARKDDENESQRSRVRRRHGGGDVPGAGNGGRN